MNINEIYYRVKSNSYTEEDLTFLLSDEKIMFSIDSFVICCAIIEELQKNNEIEFINKFIAICKESKKTTAKVFRIIFDKMVMNDNEVKILIENGGIISSNPVLANATLKAIKNKVDENTFTRLIYEYYDNILMLADVGEISIDHIVNNLNLEYLYNLKNGNTLVNLINTFGDNSLFKDKVLEFFMVHPEKKFTTNIKPSLELDVCQYISKNVIYNNMLLDELLKFDSILKNYCEYDKGYDFSEVSMIKLYYYFYKTTGVEDMKSLLLPLFGNDINNNKLHFEEDWVQLIFFIIKLDKTMKLEMDYKDVDSYYDELCKLEPNNIIIDFQGVKDDGKMTFNQYKKAKKFYDDIGNEIKKYNFTPLEAYLYAYNKTINFKSYKFYRDDEKLDHQYPQLSRNPFYIVNNDYIVCAGYVNFMLEVLKRINISAGSLTIGPKECDSDHEYHAQVLVHMKDDKYHVNGIYIGEVTNNSSGIVDDTYVKALLTKSKESYYKYQIGENTKHYFLYAMKDFDISDEYKNDENSNFFDIINRKIPSLTMSQALENMFLKMNPKISEEELADKMYQSGFMHSGTLKKQVADDSVHRLFLRNFDVMLDEKIINNINFEPRFISSSTDITFHVVITDNIKTKEEVMEILINNKSLFENEFLSFYYDEVTKGPGIKITVPREFTFENLKRIFSKAVYSINQVLDYETYKYSSMRKK